MNTGNNKQNNDEKLKDVYSCLSFVSDYRVINRCWHKLSDILFIGLVTVLSGGEDFEDMRLFGKTHLPFLKEFIDLPNGVPSSDTFSGVFSNLHRNCLSDYGKDIISVLSEKQLCLDGKKLKGVSPTSRGNKGLHILNAWVAENNICIGQERVDDKGNEITAIPSLIKKLDIEGSVVSIDAIGCQKEIAHQIIEQKGDYLLSLKANQQALLDDVVCGFKACVAESVSDEWDYRAARVKSLFNAESGCNWEHTAELPIESMEWKVGLVVGASGSGKTSIGSRIFDKPIYDLYAGWDSTKPIVDCIAPTGDFNDVTGALSAVGLGDVPAWLRPFHVLSNGEKFRAGLARLICERPDRVVIDEFTSVIDRQIAKIGAQAFVPRCAVPKIGYKRARNFMGRTKRNRRRLSSVRDLASAATDVQQATAGIFEPCKHSNT